MWARVASLRSAAASLGSRVGLAPVSLLEGVTSLQVRWKSQPHHTSRVYNARKTGMWCQPLLKALAPLYAPGEPGRGRSRKKAMQKKQQIMQDHAIRQAGHRRKSYFRNLRIQKEHDAVRGVYREYADILRQKALARKADGADAPVGAPPMPPL